MYMSVRVNITGLLFILILGKFAKYEVYHLLGYDAV
jgi:hypothetical protein